MGKGKEALCGRQKIDDLWKIVKHLAPVTALGLIRPALTSFLASAKHQK